MEIADDQLSLEIIIVDDSSDDDSSVIAKELSEVYPSVKVLTHETNQGKGAALRTGFKKATGNFVAVQDADLEYDPRDLKKLIGPLKDGVADVVLGSRFLSQDAHRVLYFWHYLGNKFLTFVSNMFTDLNLTDMETCYKVFKREVIQQIEIKENRFGFEPEIVAKVAHMRVRIYEMGISYFGRTYAEGKKIGAKDGARALYCIFRYNAHRSPLPIQFIIYLLIGGVAAIVNLLIFLGLYTLSAPIYIAVLSAFIIAATVNYLLCIIILFRHQARWNSTTEIIIYIVVVCLVALLDLCITWTMLNSGISPVISKLTATIFGLTINFLGRRYFVFPEPSSGAWM